MPEGDTIRLAASRIARVLAGREVVDARAPRARDPSLRLVRTLVGRCCIGVHSHGKHLLVEFEGGLVLHSHLRMSGSWVVTERSAADAGVRTGPSTRRRRETTSRLWLELLTDKHAVRQYGGPVLELRSRAGAALALARVGLGPDILAADFDLETAVTRLAALDRRLAIADALLDQRALSGIGNIWRAEACFASGIDPFTPVGALTHDDLRTLVGRARELMLAAVATGSTRPRPVQVYSRAGRPCRVCGTAIAARRSGEQGRTIYWCPRCQRRDARPAYAPTAGAEPVPGCALHSAALPTGGVATAGTRGRKRSGQPTSLSRTR